MAKTSVKARQRKRERMVQRGTFATLEFPGLPFVIWPSMVKFPDLKKQAGNL